MSRAIYQCTALLGTNKKGVLKADADGYYEVTLGAFDYHNSVGDFYPLSDKVKEMFEESGSLQRRIKNAALRGEYGHPKYVPGQSAREFLSRVMEIRETNVCMHISEVAIDTSSFSNEAGKKIPVVIGRIKPSGPMGEHLAASLENAKENVCFSVRSLTDDVETTRGSGMYNKFIRHIVTWDYVNEPGINIANKFNFPSMESLDQRGFDLETLMMARGIAAQHARGMESDQVRQFDEAIRSFKTGNTEKTESGLIVPSTKARWVNW